ncbi:MAG: tetratricopeptide repeat protein [Sedimentisphaerales bacterium]|nr:tetratricopeptide repeat protein [Sedimentisphaerales bacterium]
MKLSSNKLRTFVIYTGLALFTFTAFEKVLNSDFIKYYDDDKYVLDNPHVKQGLSAKSIIWAFTTSEVSNWHPLTWLSHMMDYQLFGLNPRWHHLTNLLLHIASVLLLFKVLESMTGAVWPSAFVAAAFAGHPLRVESVAWVAERKDVLSVFFWMLTVWAYIRYVQKSSLKRYIIVFIFLALGLMAKAMLITLPLVLLLLDYWPLGRLKLKSETLMGDFSDSTQAAQSRASKSKFSHLIDEKRPLFFLSFVSLAVTYTAQHRGGGVQSSYVFPLAVRLANVFVSYLAYIVKLLYPSGLAPFYPHSGVDLSISKAIASFLVIAGISAGAIYMGRSRKYLLVGWLWYLITLVPVIGLIQVGSQAMADRYTYIPSIGILIIAGWGVAELTTKLPWRKLIRTAASALVLAALLLCTRRQVNYWQDNLTLSMHSLAVTKDNYLMHNNYACSLGQMGLHKQALEHFEQALGINPRFLEAKRNMGIAFLMQGKVDKAIDCFGQVLAANKNQPEVYNDLATAYNLQGRYDLAIQHCKKALELKPGYLAARRNLELALAKKGKIDTRKF